MVESGEGGDFGMKEPWKGYTKPFPIWGNLYFVGTEPASTHIVDTGDGLIMFDSGYQHSLYQVIHNMHLLGLNPLNVKYILHTHGHIDHMGATRALVELTGCKTAIGEPDREYVNGTLNLSYADELGMEFHETFEPDILLHDGDEIVLGNTRVRSMATPGHTPGAMTYYFDVTDGKKTYRAGLHGGMGINTMCREFLDKYHLSYDCSNQFLSAMDRLAEEKVDIFLGNHMQHNHTLEKYRRLCEGDKEAFVGDSEWRAYAIWAKQNLLNMMEKEKKNE